jgi:FkbM family methyltransferase
MYGYALGIDHAPIIEILVNEEFGHIPDANVIVDIGASIGTFTIFAGTMAPSARVYAFEPCPETFAVLDANVRLNGWADRIRCENVAVASQSEERQLLLKSESFTFPTLARGGPLAEGDDVVSVRCMTLAEILARPELERVDLLKMDCEGAEYEILFGAAPETFAQIREIRMEYHDLGPGLQGSDIATLLSRRGYLVERPKENQDGSGILWAKRS